MHRHRAAPALAHHLDQRQPDPAPARVARLGGVPAAEEVRRVVRGYAGTGVRDLDDDGRIMVLATHNTDVGDGWEREAYGEWYFETFSTKSYMVGVNVIIYAMTH